MLSKITNWFFTLNLSISSSGISWWKGTYSEFVALSKPILDKYDPHPQLVMANTYTIPCAWSPGGGYYAYSVVVLEGFFRKGDSKHRFF